MNLDKFSAIKTFIAVSDSSGFAAASSALGISTSQASRQIAALERSLGVRLLHRTTRVVSLTGAGQAYLDRARAILAELDEAERAVSELESGPSGKLAVSLPPLLGGSFLNEFIVEFATRYPRLQIAVDTSARLAPQDAGVHDVILRLGERTAFDAPASRLSHLSLGLFAAPAYCSAKGRPRVPEDLAGHDALLLDMPGSAGSWSLRSATGEKQVAVRPRLSSSNPDSLIQAAIAGLGIVLLPALLAQRELESGSLIRLLSGFEPKPLCLWSLWRPAPLVIPKAQLFTGQLADHLARRSRAGS